MSLGITYEILDKILIAHYEQGLGVKEIEALGFDGAQAEAVIKRADSYAFKRALEPPYPDVAFYA